jgi:hypothetical protein
MRATTRSTPPNAALSLTGQKLYEGFKGPAAVIAKHNRKAMDFARYTAMKAKEETPDKKLVESAMTFQSLHESLLQELPVFLSLVCELVEAVVHQFTIAQAGISPVCAVEANLSLVSSLDGGIVEAYDGSIFS